MLCWVDLIVLKYHLMASSWFLLHEPCESEVHESLILFSHFSFTLIFFQLIICILYGITFDLIKIPACFVGFFCN